LVAGLGTPGWRAGDASVSKSVSHHRAAQATAAQTARIRGMLRLMLDLPQARNPGTEDDAEGNVDHHFALLDDMVIDLMRPIKTIPKKNETSR
jgi:hypothetical protein